MHLPLRLNKRVDTAEIDLRPALYEFQSKGTTHEQSANKAELYSKRPVKLYLLRIQEVQDRRLRNFSKSG